MKRQTIQLSEPLHKRLNAYALAASAAGVGVLAMAQPAEARIVYTGTNAPANYYSLDVNNDGTIDFEFASGWTFKCNETWGSTAWY